MEGAVIRACAGTVLQYVFEDRVPHIYIPDVFVF